MGESDPLAACIGFDWDQDNAVKNWERHRVTPEGGADQEQWQICTEKHPSPF